MLPELISTTSLTTHGLAAATILDTPEILSLTPQLLLFNADAITGQLPTQLATAAPIERLLMIFSLPLRPAESTSLSLTASATITWFAIAQYPTPSTDSMMTLYSIATTQTAAV